jgi:hypothetical protein
VGIAVNAPSGYAVNDSSLSVSPDQGGPDARFTVVYRWPAGNARKHSTARTCMPTQITFRWDSSSLGRAPSTLAEDGCAATLRVAAPAGAYGTHTISVTNDESARASYEVTEHAAGTPSAAIPGSADPAVDPPVPVMVPTTPSQAATAMANQQQGAGGWAGWLIAFGLVLALAGAGMFGVMIWRTRHPKPDPDEPWSPEGFDTQQLPVHSRAVRPAAHRAPRRFG